ncbi:hypothetical protein PMAYCL1PPCAC_18335, partial [Pristionchus mayeri]
YLNCSIVLLLFFSSLGESNFAIGRTNFRPGRKRADPSLSVRASSSECSPLDPACAHLIDSGYRLTRHRRYRTPLIEY